MNTLNKSEELEVVGGMINVPSITSAGSLTDPVTEMLMRWLYRELFGPPEV